MSLRSSVNPCEPKGPKSSNHGVTELNIRPTGAFELMGNLTVASLDDGIHGTMENGEPWE